MSTYLKDGDVEEGAAAPLYPMMTENPELRWAFIRKIYAILTVQLLLTVAVCAVVVALHPTADFLVSTNLGRFLFKASLVMPFVSEHYSHFLPILSSLFPDSLNFLHFISRP